MRYFLLFSLLILSLCLFSEEIKIEEYAALSSDTISSSSLISDDVSAKGSVLSVSKRHDAPSKEEAKEIKPQPVYIIDSGTKTMIENSVYVKFTKEFTEELAMGKKPFVTVTPNSPGVTLYVTDKTQYGFTVRTYSGNKGFDFDWIAVGR